MKSPHPYLVIFFFCLVVVVALGLLWPASQPIRDTPIISSDSNKLKSIALAIYNYEHDHGHFPPPFIPDEKGKPMHSWRVLLLPYLEEDNMFKQYRMDEPWNGPNNRKLATKSPRCYQSILANNLHEGNKGETNFLAVTGSGTFWEFSGKLTVKQLGDRAPKVVTFVINDGMGINWMEPSDLDIETMEYSVPSPRGLGVYKTSPHAFADGSVHQFQKPPKPEALRNLFLLPKE